MYMRLFSLILSLQLAILQLFAADQAVGLLHADGLVTVQGADIAEASVTVVPANAPSYELDKGTRSFKLELPLNDTYLVIFAHPKCLTKQLFFDTRVPADYTLDHYTFPFEVVLEAQLTEDRSYIGPVGYIMYRDLVNDFDYETNYTLQIDEKLKERMNSVNTTAATAYVPAATEREPAGTPASLSAVPSSTPATTVDNSPSTTATVVGASSSSDPSIAKAEPPVRSEPEAQPIELNTITIEPEPVAFVPAAPVAAKVETVPVSGPPVIEVEDPAPIEEPAAEEAIVEDVAPAPAAEEVAGPAPGDRELASETPIQASDKPASTGYRLPSGSNRTGHEFKQVDPMQFGRQEELIVEANKVTTIVRIVNELGYMHEYRRVAHKFGPVYYFKDDQSIPAHMYEDGSGLPAN